LIGSVEYFNIDSSNDGPQIAAAINAYTVTALGAGGYLTFATATGTTGVEGASPIERARIASNGDISFYEDTGTTPKFFWDASAEALGILTSSPLAPLSVGSGSLADASIKIQTRIERFKRLNSCRKWITTSTNKCSFSLHSTTTS
jgi:hypothetical protein